MFKKCSSNDLHITWQYDLVLTELMTSSKIIFVLNLCVLYSDTDGELLTQASSVHILLYWLFSVNTFLEIGSYVFF